MRIDAQKVEGMRFKTGVLRACRAPPAHLLHTYYTPAAFLLCRCYKPAAHMRHTCCATAGHQLRT